MKIIYKALCLVLTVSHCNFLMSHERQGGSDKQNVFPELSGYFHNGQPSECKGTSYMCSRVALPPAISDQVHDAPCGEATNLIKPELVVEYLSVEAAKASAEGGPAVQYGAYLLSKKVLSNHISSNSLFDVEVSLGLKSKNEIRSQCAVTCVKAPKGKIIESAEVLHWDTRHQHMLPCKNDNGSCDSGWARVIEGPVMNSENTAACATIKKWGKYNTAAGIVAKVTDSNNRRRKLKNSPYYFLSELEKSKQSRSHTVTLKANRSYSIDPIELPKDQLYFSIEVISPDGARVCKIKQWKGSSGTLGNGVVFKSTKEGNYKVRISKMDKTFGPYYFKVSKYQKKIKKACNQRSNL